MFLGVSAAAWSAIALLVSVFALWHSHWRWSRDAARVKVTWEYGRLTPYMMESGPIPNSRPSKRMARRAVGAQGESYPRDLANVEVLIIRVENGGRTGVTVGSPALEFHPWRFRPPSKLELLPAVPARRSIGDTLLDHDGACTEQAHRLEPFDEATYIMRAEPMLASFKNLRPCWVRVAVRVAGQPRVRRSPPQTAMKLNDDQVTIDGEHPDFVTVVYRGLFPLNRETASLVAHEVQAARSANPEVAWSDLVEKVMPWAPEMTFGLTQVDSLLVKFGHITEEEAQHAHARRMRWRRGE